ncbi:thioredoxin fold domain-containing protein [Leptospirillum ferriphilum]|uniref:thioredoxin fold domain-containing protein n=1 Tax=Leptospirillum ferriphilum TaxID=178606 RepID=UPI0006B187AC|nr:thioredoxin fold domain-containing protein [Leptospirillum ferriphilum]
MRKKILIAGISAMLLSGCVHHHKDVPSTQEISRLVSSVTGGIGTVQEVFPGPSGLTGAVIAGGSTPAVVWITPDGKSLIAGNVFDERKKNYTDMAFGIFAKPMEMELLAQNRTPVPPSPPPVPRLSSLSALENAAFVPEGTGKRILWIFMDPNCAWCHKLWVVLHASPVPADIQVRWIPVGFLHPDSVPKAERILKEGFRALQKDEDHFDTVHESGGIRGIENASLKKKIDRNLVLMGSMMNIETPALVFNTSAGPKIFMGFPSGEDLRSIMGRIRVSKQAGN